MDARAVLHPVGPHEPRVYWTRRAFLLIAILVVLVLFTVYACSGGGNRPTSADRGTTPTASPTPTATPSTPAAVTTCARTAVTVAASTDAATYPAGVLPRLIATIRTTGATACTLPAAAVTWEIVSGPDKVFSTAGCPNPVKTAFTIRPNHPTRSGFVWNRHRSVTGCATPGAAAGPGTYQLRATVDGVRSAAAVFHLTG
jgi:hypothetical protein